MNVRLPGRKLARSGKRTFIRLVESQRRKTAQLCYNAAKAFVLIVVTYRAV